MKKSSITRNETPGSTQLYDIDDVEIKMKNSYYILSLVSFLSLALALSSCQRENFDGNVDEQWTEYEPEIIYGDTLTTAIGQTNIELISKISEEPIRHQGGTGLVELIQDNEYSMEVVVRQNQYFSGEPFLMQWFHDGIQPGISVGEYGIFGLANGDNIIAGALASSGTYFNVELEEIGEMFEPMVGTYEGVGIIDGSQEFVSFQGSFSVPRKSRICGDEIVVNNSFFHNLASEDFVITDASISGQCLDIRFESCRIDPYNTELVIVDSGSYVMKDGIPNRKLKFMLEFVYDCTEFEESGISFSLELVKLPNFKEVNLNIENWGEPLLFEY